MAALGVSMLWILIRLLPKVLFISASVVLILLLSACASTISSVQAGDYSVSYALAEPGATFLGRLLEQNAEKHPGASGFAIVAAGWEAFRIRYAFAALAEK